MEWRGRQVLVTGASGIVGSWLCRALVARGARVSILLRDGDAASELIRSGLIQRVVTIRGELRDHGSVLRAVCESGAETVFHLGAETLVPIALRNPLQTLETNIRGTYHLLETCRTLGCIPLVLASSDKAYGAQQDLPYTEDSPLLGRHPYDASKACADILALTYFQTYDLPVAIARCGNIFGGGDLNWSRLIPGTLRSLLSDEPPIIRSDGRATRDYLYVEDAAEAYVLLAEGLAEGTTRGKAYNFSLGTPLSALAVVDRLRAVTGRVDLEPVVLDQARHEIPAQHLSSERARSELGWSPTHGFESGLARTVRWYREYFQAGPEARRP